MVGTRARLCYRPRPRPDDFVRPDGRSGEAGQPDDLSGASLAVGFRRLSNLVHGRPRRAAAPGSTYARC